MSLPYVYKAQNVCKYTPLLDKNIEKFGGFQSLNTYNFFVSNILSRE